MLLVLSSLGWAAGPKFTAQQRIGLVSGDQWEPSLAADGFGHLFVLYPHYGNVPDCDACRTPTMLLVASYDNGRSWQRPRVMLASGSGQYDAQIVVDPADRRTLYAAWLQDKKRSVVVARSGDAGNTWSFTIAVRSDVELDKPALAVRGSSVYVAFNHEEEVWMAASQDAGRSFTPGRVNTTSRPGWSLLGAATVDPAGNLYLAWAAYSKLGGARGPVGLFVGRSQDAGKSWSESLLDISAAAPGCKEEDCGEGYLGAQVSLAADAAGTIYALWSAGSKAMGPQRVYFSSSTNSGENWLPRADVSNAAAGAEHAFPEIVAGNGGDVRIAWMDQRKSPYWNTYFRGSTNGGATWGEEIRVSHYVPGYRYIRKDGFRFPFGDYFGFAIDNHGDTQIVWGEGLNYQSPGSIWHSSGR